jgi:hypothetical protein
MHHPLCSDNRRECLNHNRHWIKPTARQVIMKSRCVTKTRKIKSRMSTKERRSASQTNMSQTGNETLLMMTGSTTNYPSLLHFPCSPTSQASDITVSRRTIEDLKKTRGIVLLKKLLNGVKVCWRKHLKIWRDVHQEENHCTINWGYQELAVGTPMENVQRKDYCCTRWRQQGMMYQ